MPLVSRALKRNQLVRAERLLGDAVGDPRLGRLAVRALNHQPIEVSVPEDSGPLTRAQWVVIWAGACGLTSAETAKRYHRGVETVKTHRRNAYRALGLHENEVTIAGAVAVCYRRGLFDRNDPLEPVAPSEW